MKTMPDPSPTRKAGDQFPCPYCGTQVIARRFDHLKTAQNIMNRTLALVEKGWGK